MSELEKKLTNIEVEAIKAMNDSRNISDTLKNEFLTKGGAFHQFYLKTKNEPDLVICFRGNSNPEKIIIYYNNHVLWELYLKQKKEQNSYSYCVGISFNHSRYYVDYEKALAKLRSLGFDKDSRWTLKPTVSKEKGKFDGIGYNGAFKCVDGDYSNDFVASSYEIMKCIVDTYFNPTMDKDYFRDYWEKHGDGTTVSPNAKRKSSYVEKRWQSHLFNYFKNTQNGLFVYDLEFSQPFPNQAFLKSLDKDNEKKNYADLEAAVIKSKIKEVINEPDMLAVRYEKGAPVALVLVEVKSTRTACTGSSSIFKHMRGMYAYSNEPIFMKKRITEARDLLQAYKEIDVCDENANINIPDDIRVERLIILTDNSVPEKTFTEKEKLDVVNQSAIDYFENIYVNQKIMSAAKDNKCSIWLIRNRYDQDYSIEKILEL